MKVFTAQQMHDFDQRATNEYSIPSMVLMENAALRVVEFLEWKFAPLQGKKIVVLCGKGNNGGDGFAIARHLVDKVADLRVLLACSFKDFQGDAAINMQAFERSFDNVHSLNTEIVEAVEGMGFDEMLSACGGEGYQADVIVDALLGTGFRGVLEDRNLRNALYFFGEARGAKVSVDLPSALNSNTGEIAELAAKANHTITFAAPKRGMLLRDGVEKCGEIWVGDIGTAPSQMEQTLTGCEAITREAAHRLLPHRPVDAHKGTAGRVVVIGGSRGMSGAPTLASTAALRVGAGLCLAAVPDRVLDAFAASVLEATSRALPCDDEGPLVESAADLLPDILRGADVCALGPGLSRSDSALNFARRVVRECSLPLIIDADALYSLRAIADDVKSRTAPTILTPHPGEMAELMESSVREVNDNRLETVIECAQKYNAFVVLKGARSVVAAPSGETPNGETWFNLTGNAGMATGGSGDVLTGTIAGLFAQLKNALDATLLGVYLHGLAGDIEYSKSGNGLVAHDIANALPHAILDLQNRPQAQSINARLRKLE